MDIKAKQDRLDKFKKEGLNKPDVLFNVKNLGNGNETQVPGDVISGFLDPAEYTISVYEPEVIPLAEEKPEPKKTSTKKGDK